MKDELKFMVGRYHAKPMVIETDDRRFQGVVLLYEGDDHHSERHVVPVVSGTYKEALEEARALAHKVIEKHALNDAKNRA